MTTVSYREVLNAAHRLPPAAQAKLAAALLRGLKPQPETDRQASDASGLEPLPGLSGAELQVLAEAVVAPGQQKALEGLLEKNRVGSLTAEEETSLDELLAQVDQVGLLKARAQYTLSLGEGSEESPE